MRDSRKDFCFYVGLAYVKKEYRKLGGGAEFYPSIIEVGRHITEKWNCFFPQLNMLLFFQKAISQNGMFIDTVTVTALLKSSKATYGEMYNIVDSIEYTNQKLAKCGVSVFEPIYKAGGIYLIVPELN